MLLESGMSSNQVSSKDYTMLHAALIMNDTEWTKELLENGCDYSFSARQNNPLYYAVDNKSVDQLDLLLESMKNGFYL